MSSVSFGTIFATVNRDKPNQEKIIKSIPEKVPGAIVDFLYRIPGFKEDHYTIKGLTKEVEQKLITRLKDGYRIEAYIASEEPEGPIEFSWFA